MLESLSLVLPPPRIPAGIARFVVGDAGVVMMDEARGSSNAEAKRALAWRPKYASRREGFRQGLSGEWTSPL